VKTVVIWDQCGSESLQFFVFDKDIRDLDGVYINSTESSDEQVDKLNEVIAYDDDGRPKVKMLSQFPLQAVKDGASVIVCGFIP
jgi:hypothetical protein